MTSAATRALCVPRIISPATLVVTLILVFAVLVTHGVVPEGAMHMDDRGGCLAVADKPGPTPPCAHAASIVPLLLIASLGALAAARSHPRRETSPAARHGPALLQVFQT